MFIKATCFDPLRSSSGSMHVKPLEGILA